MGRRFSQIYADNIIIHKFKNPDNLRLAATGGLICVQRRISHATNFKISNTVGTCQTNNSRQLSLGASPQLEYWQIGMVERWAKTNQ